MKTFFKFFTISILLLGINSCCTKKDCDNFKNGPDILVQLIGFSPLDIDNAQIILTNTNFNKIDSTSILKSNFILNTKFLPSYSEEILNIYNYAFIVKTDYSNDTIHSFNLTVSTNKIKCNTCFLADGRAEETEIQNFNYYLRGIQYFEGDTLIIVK